MSNGRPRPIVADASPRFAERRSGHDRRRASVRTFIQGGLNPRRRSSGRRWDDGGLVDWHEPHLLFLAVAILLLSVTDAFLTITLIGHGAQEVNPVMSLVLEKQPQLFAAAKIGLTCAGILVLVACARARVFRVLRVSTVIHWCLLSYAALIGYECWLLRAIA
ncbi:MAG TPA: DUF5658 family protein [Gammaproteobacteria bacterium]